MDDDGDDGMVKGNDNYHDVMGNYQLCTSTPHTYTTLTSQNNIQIKILEHQSIFQELKKIDFIIIQILFFKY